MRSLLVSVHDLIMRFQVLHEIKHCLHYIQRLSVSCFWKVNVNVFEPAENFQERML